jgi:pyrroline-5-carboxylate reductase
MSGVPAAPAVALLAVKPQMMGAALPALQAWATARRCSSRSPPGPPLPRFEDALGTRTPIVRTMPNTPAMVGPGDHRDLPQRHVSDADFALARDLMAAVGQVVDLSGEDQIDAVTAVSGSGPAYVFHLIETMAAAGEAEGLPADVAMQLARATVCGAGELAFQSPETGCTTAGST